MVVLSSVIVATVITRVVRLFYEQRGVAATESRLASSIGYLSSLEFPADIRASLGDQVGFTFDDTSNISYVDVTSADAVELAPALLGPEEQFTHAQMNPPTSDPVRNRICLLYTSPSPRDRTRSRMPSSA